jgi:two-component system sensor histidine kinase AgrC
LLYGMNYQTVLIMNSFILFWGMDSRFLLPKKTTLLLSLYLFAILFLSFFFSYNINILMLLVFLVVRFCVLLHRFQNWGIPLISFLWKTMLIASLWLFTFFLPGSFFNVSFGSSLKEVLLLFCLQLILLIFICLFTDCIVKKYNVITLLTNNKKRHKKEGITISLLYSVIFISHLFIFSTYSLSFFIFSILTLMISALLFIIFFYILTVSQQKMDEYQLLVLNFKKIKAKYEQISDFRHDYNGLLLSINGYLQAEDLEGAKNYVTSLVDYSASVLVPDYYTELDKVPIPPVQSVLASFGEQAIEQEIQFQIVIKNKITELEMELIDFIRCLSILLSNAFEAVSEQDEPIVYMNLEKTTDSILLIIKNADHSTVALNSLLVKGYTSKKTNAGRGLYIITKICDNYTGVDFSIERINQIFTATLSIKL